MYQNKQCNRERHIYHIFFLQLLVLINQKRLNAANQLFRFFLYTKMILTKKIRCFTETLNPILCNTFENFAEGTKQGNWPEFEMSQG